MRGGRSSFLAVAVALAGALAAGRATAQVPTGGFVGPESCKACHPAAFDIWLQSKHARSFESLSENQRRDARCLSCHAPNLRDHRVESISCETCHGGGQYYAARYVMKDAELVRLVGLHDPSEKSCRSCHDASSPSLRPFDFVEKLKLIDHWTAERQLRKQRDEAAAGASEAEPAPRVTASPAGTDQAPAATNPAATSPAPPARPLKKGAKPKPARRPPKKP